MELFYEDMQVKKKQLIPLILICYWYKMIVFDRAPYLMEAIIQE